MKDKLVKDIELKLAMTGYDKADVNRIMISVISCLENYEVTEATRELTVRYEDVNEQILKNYTACLIVDGKSKGTVGIYIYTLRKLAECCKKPFTEMATNDIRLYLGTLKARGKKSTYIRAQQTKVNVFFKWMLNEDLIDKDPCVKIRPVKTDNEIKFPFTSVDIDNMREAIKGKYAVRDRAMLEVLLSSGIRCDELRQLDIEDLDLKTRALVVRHGKGGKGRTVYVSEVAAEYLSRYLKSRNDTYPILFLSIRGGRISTGGIRKLLNKYGDAAHVDNVHPHRFRRTFASNMYRRGMPLEEIRRLMGHSNVQTTLGYIYTDDTQIKAAYDKYAA